MFVARMKSNNKIYMMVETKISVQAYISREYHKQHMLATRLSKVNPIAEPSLYELTHALGYESTKDIVFEGYLHLEGDTDTIYGLRFCDSNGNNKFDFGFTNEQRLVDIEEELGQLQFHKLIKLIHRDDKYISEDELAHKTLVVLDITDFGYPAEKIVEQVIERYKEEVTKQ